MGIDELGGGFEAIASSIEDEFDNEVFDNSDDLDNEAVEDFEDDFDDLDDESDEKFEDDFDDEIVEDFAEDMEDELGEYFDDDLGEASEHNSDAPDSSENKSVIHKTLELLKDIAISDIDDIRLYKEAGTYEDGKNTKIDREYRNLIEQKMKEEK